jgi:cell division protein FtsB
MTDKSPEIKDRRNWRYALLLLVLLVLALLVMEFNNRTSDLHRLEREKERVQERLDEQIGTQQSLQEAIAYATSDRAVDEFARESAKLSQPGDQVIVILPDEVTPTPAPLLAQSAQERTNLEGWWDLFFADLRP